MGHSLLPSFSTGKTYHYPGQRLSLINYTPGRGAHRRRQGCVHTRMALSTEHPSSSAQTHSGRQAAGRGLESILGKWSLEQRRKYQQEGKGCLPMGVRGWGEGERGRDLGPRDLNAALVASAFVYWPFLGLYSGFSTLIPLKF